jgi:hypothetical protein
MHFDIPTTHYWHYELIMIMMMMMMVIMVMMMMMIHEVSNYRTYYMSYYMTYSAEDNLVVFRSERCRFNSQTRW